MIKKVFTVALVTLLVVGTMSIAFARVHGRRGRDLRTEEHKPRMIEQMPEELKLTEEQQKELQALRTDFAKEMVPLRNEIQIKTLELKQLWLADELDEEAIVAKSKAISALRNQTQEKRTLHRLEAAKILTKEQRAKFSRIGFLKRNRGCGHEGQLMGRLGMRRGPRWRR